MTYMFGHFMVRSITVLCTLPIHIALILGILVLVLFIFRVQSIKVGLYGVKTYIRVDSLSPNAATLLLGIYKLSAVSM